MAFKFIPNVWPNIAAAFDADSNVENLLNTAAASFISIPIFVIIAAVSFNSLYDKWPNNTISLFSVIKFLLKFLKSILYLFDISREASTALKVVSVKLCIEVNASIAKYFASSREWPAAERNLVSIKPDCSDFLISPAKTSPNEPSEWTSSPYDVRYFLRPSAP